MPSFSDVVLNNGTADQTFKPRMIDANGVASFVKSTGVPIGDQRLTVARSRTAAGREKVSFKLTVPVVANETVNGVSRPAVLRASYCDVVLSFDGSSDTAERTAMRSMVADLMTDALAGNVIDSLESIY